MPLKDRIERIRTLPKPPNEESAKAQVILPILSELEWKSDDPSRVFFEYTVGGKRVDIALKDDDRCVAFIEAKAPGKKLTGHVSQLLGYAFEEGVDICVLTTGLEWWFFLPREKGPPPERRFLTLDLLDGSVEEISILLQRFLGRSELTSHRAESNAKTALKSLQEKRKLAVEIPRVWQTMIDGPDSDLVALVLKRVHEKTGLHATPADLVTPLGMPLSDAKPQPISPKPSDRVTPAKKKNNKKNPRPTAFRLWGRESSTTSHAKILVGVCSAIHGRHAADFIDTVRPLWGSYRPWVSSDPTELTRSAALEGSPWYVEVNLNAKAIGDRCQRLLGVFGYSNSDLEILFD